MVASGILLEKRINPRDWAINYMFFCNIVEIQNISLDITVCFWQYRITLITNGVHFKIDPAAKVL